MQPVPAWVRLSPGLRSQCEGGMTCSIEPAAESHVMPAVHPTAGPVLHFGQSACSGGSPRDSRIPERANWSDVEPLHAAASNQDGP